MAVSGKDSGSQHATIHTESSSLGSRFGTWLRTTPLATAFFTVLMICLFIWTAFENLSEYNFARIHFGNAPSNIVTMYEYWRLFTPSLFHSNFLRIFLNTVMGLLVSAPIERAVGSVCMTGLIFVFTFTSEIIYVIFSYLIYDITDDEDWVLFKSAIGYSPHIFGYIVVLIVLADLPSFSFFGRFRFPALAYPFFLFLSMFLIDEATVFSRSLSYLLCAYLYVFGLLNWMSLPRSWLLKMETSVPHFISSLSTYVPTPELQNTLLSQKHISFTRNWVWNREDGARDTSNSSTDYRSTTSLSRSAPSCTSQGSGVVFSGPDHVLGHANGTIEANAFVPEAQTEYQNAPMYSVTSSNRKRGQYSEFFDEEEESESGRAYM